MGGEDEGRNAVTLCNHGREWKGVEGSGREWKGVEGRGREWKGVERSGKEWKGSGREWKGMKRSGREWKGVEGNEKEWKGVIEEHLNFAYMEMGSRWILCGSLCNSESGMSGTDEVWKEGRKVLICSGFCVEIKSRRWR